jgi:hypothetical protein
MSTMFIDKRHRDYWTRTYILVILFAIWIAYYCLVSCKYLVMDADEMNAVVTTLKIDLILKTLHGFAYMEAHCLKERNPESLYCLMVSLHP